MRLFTPFSPHDLHSTKEMDVSTSKRIGVQLCGDYRTTVAIFSLSLTEPFGA